MTRGPGPLPAWLPVVVATVAGVVTTLLVLLAPTVPAAVRAPDLHVAIETANVLVGLLVAVLVLGRYQQDGRLHQLLLVDALVVLAAANLALGAAAAMEESAAVESLRWASVLGRLLGSALLCASALAPTGARLTRPRARVLQGVLLVTAVAGALALLSGRLPPPVLVRVVAPDGATTLDVHPVVVVSQAAGLVLLGIAAVVFTRRGLSTGDRLTLWLATGTILAAWARLHYLLYPSLLSDVVYTGDALRAGFYGCLLVGALQEIEGYWRLRARSAVLDERRRLARDLHDGMTQELTYILARSRTLVAGGTHDERTLVRIEDAAARALDEARRAIDALDREDPRSLADELRGLAADLAGRHEVAVEVDAADGPAGAPSPGAVDQLLRIVAEAVTNAVRHGGARHVRIALVEAEPAGAADPAAPAARLSVSDDGSGFSPRAARRRRGQGGYGMTSMRERAAAVGGTLEVVSAPGRGTDVTVTW
ncbi:sensor histidine kinase [Phycicoccus flavus]|uniref:Histidine kinase domain-containing protein n=1 Tax=Phycicoccus flavus TaxID=2502783 RepID=A0A8T6R1A7_9MICO|nr:ATP-binding protein [Phycicoccus flavus]NHA66585.1 hypothetical protein [Phycicoccus flavus]